MKIHIEKKRLPEIIGLGLLAAFYVAILCFTEPKLPRLLKGAESNVIEAGITAP